MHDLMHVYDSLLPQDAMGCNTLKGFTLWIGKLVQTVSARMSECVSE